MDTWLLDIVWWPHHLPPPPRRGLSSGQAGGDLGGQAEKASGGARVLPLPWLCVGGEGGGAGGVTVSQSSWFEKPKSGPGSERNPGRPAAALTCSLLWRDGV